MNDSPKFENPVDVPLKHLFAKIIRTIVDDTKSVHVDCSEHNGLTTLTLHLAPQDICKIIGKQGRTARALRTVLFAAGMKLDRRYALNIAEHTKSSVKVRD